MPKWTSLIIAAAVVVSGQEVAIPASTAKVSVEVVDPYGDEIDHFKFVIRFGGQDHTWTPELKVPYGTHQIEVSTNGFRTMRGTAKVDMPETALLIALPFQRLPLWNFDTMLVVPNSFKGCSTVHLIPVYVQAAEARRVFKVLSGRVAVVDMPPGKYVALLMREKHMCSISIVDLGLSPSVTLSDRSLSVNDRGELPK